MKKASLKSIASYVPAKTLSNFDLEKMVETSDEWIVKRTGIKTRHIAEPNEYTSDMATKAANLAISRAGISANDLDAIICATVSPDYFCMPSTANIVSKNLGITGIMSFDIEAACSGFLYSLNIAKALIESGAKRNILIIGAEKLSGITDWSDRSTCVLFGDGAGAGIVSVADDDNTIIDVNVGSDGFKGDLLITPGFAGRNPATPENIATKQNYVKMAGNEVFKIAVNTLMDEASSMLEKNNLKADDLDLFIPHQANLRIITAVQQRLNLSDDKCFITVDKYGNTSAASIPMAMNDAYEQGRLKKGDLCLLDAFGGGFTWGAALLRFGGN